MAQVDAPRTGSGTLSPTSAADSSGKRKRGDTWLYIRKFLRHGFSVAAMKPASRSLANAHCAHIDPARPQVIVEIGAGTGAVTRAGLERMHPDSKFIAVEIDEDFARILQERCPKAKVLACDARELPERLETMGIDRIDLMISCIALPMVPKPVNDAIFGCLARLGPDSWFTQQTLMPLIYKRMYHRLFQEVKLRFVPWNLPPGGVYHCRRFKPDYVDHIPGKT